MEFDQLWYELSCLGGFWETTLKIYRQWILSCHRINFLPLLLSKKSLVIPIKMCCFFTNSISFCLFFFSRTTAAASNGTAAAGAAVPANKNGESSGKNAISAALNSAQSAQRREDIRLTKMMLIIFLSFLVRKEAYNWIIFHLFSHGILYYLDTKVWKICIFDSV